MTPSTGSLILKATMMWGLTMSSVSISINIITSTSTSK